MASIDKKRRFDCSGKRAFDDAWKHEYFFCYREHDQKAMCLICKESVADLKRYNVKRHYDAKHKKCFDVSYIGKDNRMKEFKKRFEAYLGETKRVSVFTETSSHVNEASYRICYSLAQHQVPFSHAEMFKKAFMSSAEVLFASFPNKDKIVQQIGKLPLSSDTCARRCDDLSGDIFVQLMAKLRACPAFSLALDESTDHSDTAQLMVSVRYFDDGVSEDFLCLIPLKGTTTARDVCTAVVNFGEENDLPWGNLISVCTDGAPSMLGRQAGFVALLRQAIGKPNLISHHCIIHKQALCVKTGCGLQDTMKTVVDTVNVIRARSLNHRRFHNHLAALDDAEFGDVLFYNNVRWLSRGACLERFVALFPHIVSFLVEIGRPVAHLENDKFRVRLCVLTDIFGHLNKLNLLLQGRAKLLCNLYEAVKGFEGKVALFKLHAKDGNFLHFNFTREFCGEDAERSTDAKLVLADVLTSLETAFNGRFADFAAVDDICCFFASPFTAEPAICPKLSQTFAVDEAALQDNFIDFKVVPGLRNDFNAAKDDITLFWATLVPRRFPVLNEVAQKFLVLFGSTWSCESGFSAMNHIKNTLRCRLSDTRLRHLLRLSISPLCPQFSQLSRNMQHHPSH